MFLSHINVSLPPFSFPSLISNNKQIKYFFKKRVRSTKRKTAKKNKIKKRKEEKQSKKRKE